MKAMDKQRARVAGRLAYIYSTMMFPLSHLTDVALRIELARIHGAAFAEHTARVNRALAGVPLRRVA